MTISTINNPEDLLSPEACRALKERFGKKWRKAWLAWQDPRGTWVVTKVEWLTANHGIPANSGDMFFFPRLGKPTQAELTGMLSTPGARPALTYTAEELMKAFGRGTVH